MNIGVIGAGFVGLVTASCLASNKNPVTCIEINKKKINNLKSKKITIFEPNLKKIFEKKFNKTLFFRDNYEDINRFDIIFITVGTPYSSNKVNLSSIKDSIMNILKNYNKKKKDNYCY